jgi:glycosyltransferase involved in cell wall biosynthesis
MKAGGRGKSKLRVLMLAGWLAGGGAERVVVHLLRGRDTVGVDLQLGLLRREGAYMSEIDPSEVHYRAIGERLFPGEGSNASFYLPHRFLMGLVTGPLVYRAMIRDVVPDVVMSVGRGASLVAYFAFKLMGKKRPPWIIREGNNFAANTGSEMGASSIRNIGAALTRKAYRTADCILVNSDGLAEDFHQLMGIQRDRLRVVRNPIDVGRVRKMATEPLPMKMDEPFLFTAGRLEPQKAHDLLLRAFATSEHRNTHRLVIAGQGGEEGKLKALAGELGIADRVDFAGFQANPWAWMARADLFVLPSRWEGSPNALAEAMACGAPVVATDCRFGPAELIDDGKDGLLVPVDDKEALTGGIDRLLGDPKLRKRLGAAAQAKMERFDLDSMLPLYGQLFADVATAGRLTR